ncbi:MAG: hypothetical protein ABIF85_01905 [Nanoarchaeota archaeon]|nr:hypothetical protein [Nanoarchaeota archaeon]MBU4300024.1 hypothetical protein [Nanoarchaeota archaeon]MBU4451399.1 hypothetical protein [Nanoarchaeota archaeon]MCG2724193.1 hypothetical protein [archaeon]
MFSGNRKGVSPLLAGALYVGIVSVALLIVMQIASPAITKMQDVAAVDQAKDSFANLDKIIQDVASEGRGSTRVVPLQIKKGDITIDSANDMIVYGIETDAEMISPRTRRVVGNLIFSANTNVNVADSGTEIIIENEHIIATFNKSGNATNYTTIDANMVIKSIFLKNANTTFDGVIKVRIDGSDSNGVGNGYVRAEETGPRLARGRVIIHVNNTFADYDIYYTLESGRDHFNEISVRNFNEH